MITKKKRCCGKNEEVDGEQYYREKINELIASI